MLCRILLAMIAGSCLTQNALAQRAETLAPATVTEFETCPLTPLSALAAERDSTKEFLGPLLATLFAGFAGNLVTSGFNALGDALDNASKEHAFVAEGTAGFYLGKINPATASQKQAEFENTEHCIVLFLPSNTGRVEDIFLDPALSGTNAPDFEWKGDQSEQDEIAKKLKQRGLATLPLLYVEMTIFPGKEGLMLRPNLVWYRTVLKGAPKTQAAAELHITLATPGFDAKTPGIGSAFSGARLSLPQLKPGDLLGWKELRSSSSVWIPLRPTTGFVDTTVQALNTGYTLIATRKAEEGKAAKSVSAALRVQAKKPGPEADEALEVANENWKDAKASYQAAQAEVAGKTSQPAGATNIQMRFAVVRDENKFGQAIAKALKSQADAAGKGVTEGLSPKDPKPEWAAGDTLYLTAMIDVQAKQKLFDDAIAAGDMVGITKAGNDLKIAKAKANEAAVSAKKAIPFPGLLSDL